MAGKGQITCEMKIKRREKGRKPGLDADVVENTSILYYYTSKKKTRENHVTSGEKCATSGCACTHHPTLRVTFASHGTCTRVRKNGGKRLRNFGCAYANPSGDLRYPWYLYYSKKKTRETVAELPVAHPHTFRVTFGHFRWPWYFRSCAMVHFILLLQ